MENSWLVQIRIVQIQMEMDCDLEEVNDCPNPLVVELDGAEVEALAPVRVSKGLKKDFRYISQ